MARGPASRYLRGRSGHVAAAYVADVTDHRTVLERPTHRTSGRLAVAMLLVALAALGCGANETPEPTRGAALAPDNLQRIRSAADGVDGARRGPFDTDRPTIGNLDPDLLAAVRAAAREARVDGVRMSVTSGWRSRAHQQRLFDEAVAKYGSEEEARRWVSTPDTSAHVTGDAVDLGPAAADHWLSRHGSDYGLCQTFANEIWHFELATTPGGECPETLPDSSSRH